MNQEIVINAVRLWLVENGYIFATIQPYEIDYPFLRISGSDIELWFHEKDDLIDIYYWRGISTVEYSGTSLDINDPEMFEKLRLALK